MNETTTDKATTIWPPKPARASQAQGNEGEAIQTFERQKRMMNNAFREVDTFVRTKPYAAVAGAGIAGLVLGGIFFSRLGQMVFIAAAGYVASQAWKKAGPYYMSQLTEELGGEQPG